jgi:hypothetical protein
VPELLISKEKIVRNRWNYRVCALLLLILVGCGGAPSAGSPPAAASGAGAEGSAPPTAAPYPSDAQAVVEAFLQAIQNDASGKTSVVYLSPNLEAEYQHGTPIGMILGIQNMYHSFTVQPAVSTAADAAQVQATLEFSSGSEQRMFAVARQADRWQITSITAGMSDSPLAAPSGQEAYPADAASVVRDFLTTLQTDTSGAHSTRYLNPSLAQRIDQGPPVVGLFGEQSVYNSFEVRQSPAPSGTTQAITTVLYFGSGDQTRVFVLDQVEGIWKISQVS